MSSVDAAKADPAQAAPWWQPWWWMLIGLALTAAAFIWPRCLPRDQTPLDAVQLPLVTLGVLSAGLGLWRRCASPLPTAYLDALSAPRRRTALLLLAAIHGLIALAVSGLVAARFGGSTLPGDSGGSILLWLLTAPWCGWSAWYLWKRAQDAQPLPVRLETAVLTTQGGLAAFLASWALYWGPEFIEAWDSLRLFLSVLAAVAFLAAPIAAAEAFWRRVAVSALVVLHFAAILTVVIGAQPGPYIVGQAQHWIFRPYVEFMFLNNAYRFYSPEPSPASQLWFRIEYQNGNNITSRWIKLPDLNDQGNAPYISSVQLTRRLALTEGAARNEPTPPMTVYTADGRIKPARFVELRDQQLPNPTNQGALGMPPVKSLGIPLYPDPSVQNYQKPGPDGRQLLSSYARFVLRQPHPKNPDAKPVRVKIYRVLHRIVSAQALAMGADPHDFVYYVPFYVGQFDAQGRLLDPDDPLLYWALPNMPDPATGNTRCYIYRHSGDESQFIRPGEKVRTMIGPGMR